MPNYANHLYLSRLRKARLKFIKARKVGRPRTILWSWISSSTKYLLMEPLRLSFFLSLFLLLSGEVPDLTILYPNRLTPQRLTISSSTRSTPSDTTSRTGSSGRIFGLKRFLNRNQTTEARHRNRSEPRWSGGHVTCRQRNSPSRQHSMTSEVVPQVPHLLDQPIDQRPQLSTLPPLGAMGHLPSGYIVSSL
jgi:hypothetical protein